MSVHTYITKYAAVAVLMYALYVLCCILATTLPHFSFKDRLKREKKISPFEGREINFF